MPQSHNEVRNIYIERLKEDLMGPKFGKDEVIDQNPTSRYLIGTLWPKLDQRAEDEEENYLESENLIQEDLDSDIIDNPSSIFNRKKPSSAGLSFQADIFDSKTIKVELNFAKL